MMYNEKYEEMKKEAVADIIEALENGFDGYYCDLHSEVFNTDYYVIGRDEAEDILEEYGVFDAIHLVQNYEKEQFGEVYTDLSEPEKVLNMVYYIIGDEVIYEMYKIEEFNNGWNDKADEEINKAIIEAMKKMYNC